jgi:putative colanic acid biosynthesis acetyltransferase WcaB
VNADSSFREWVTQDSPANRRRVCKLILAWFRLAQWALARWGAASSLVLAPYRVIVVMVLGVDLPADTAVGPRLALFHPQGIVVHPDAVIGADVNMLHGVTIGITRPGTGAPRIGNGVELGAGCAVIGDIEVGERARVGANAVVVKSVPPGAVVAANPATVLRVDSPETVER